MKLKFKRRSQGQPTHRQKDVPNAVQSFCLCVGGLKHTLSTIAQTERRPAVRSVFLSVVQWT